MASTTGCAVHVVPVVVFVVVVVVVVVVLVSDTVYTQRIPRTQ